MRTEVQSKSIELGLRNNTRVFQRAERAPVLFKVIRIM